MKYSLTTKNLELTPSDLNLLDKKLERLEKYVRPPFQVDVVLRRDRHHLSGETVMCKINIEQGRTVSHGERQGETVQEALDEVIAALKKELIKSRQRGRKW